MKNRSDAVRYLIPRRDVWYATLTDDERSDILSLRDRMDCDEAIRYIMERYGKKISKASYYRAINRLNRNRLAATQLKAASAPPALDCLKEITKTVKSIDKTLRAILSRQK